MYSELCQPSRCRTARILRNAACLFGSLVEGPITRSGVLTDFVFIRHGQRGPGQRGIRQRGRMGREPGDMFLTRMDR